MCNPSYKTCFCVLISLYVFAVASFLVFSSWHPDFHALHPASTGAVLQAAKESHAQAAIDAMGDPLKLLQYRLAAGEISPDEFRERSQLLLKMDAHEVNSPGIDISAKASAATETTTVVTSDIVEGGFRNRQKDGESREIKPPANEVKVDIVSSAPGHPNVVRGKTYDAHVTLSIELADGKLQPSGWSTRVEDGGNGSPFKFSPGVGLIAGWTEGVLKMREGERAYLHVPSALGYGSSAQGTAGGSWYIQALSTGNCDRRFVFTTVTAL